MITPFRIAVDQTALDDLALRLRTFRQPPSPEDRGWEDGTDLDYLAELIAYWRDSYDWRAHEAALNRFGHFTTEIGDARLHFLHEKGRGPTPLPLLLAHGWPDGFQRFVKLIPLLTDPTAHGGDAADAFDVVVPSLPGFGFSPRLAQGAGHAQFGGLFHTLMTDVLGYARYGAHGGDVGATVCEQLCRNHFFALVGVHMTNVPLLHARTPPKDLSAAEQLYLAGVEKFRVEGGGYMHLQGTKPWTPAAALNDSPAGLAAWIVEKFHDWSDCGGDVERRFTKDELLTNVMLYWVTQSIGTSFLYYRDLAKPGVACGAVEKAKDALSPKGAPTGFAVFPKEIANAPREWAERFYDVRQWTEMPAGGHFAALEEPERLAEDLRAFFRPLRQAG
jgi:pimeloyl-ACP methyl ester carboxylesterase